MQERHLNRTIYFKEQSTTTKKYVIPFIEDVIKVDSSIRLLEIGCGEGGNLPPFLEQNIETIGVDINAKQVENGKEYMSDYIEKGLLRMIASDIYLLNDGNGEDIGKFDLIIMRDVIEHIHNQDKFLNHLHKFLKPNGKVFFGFPPWYMPFGGHQQVAKGKVSKLPFIHLLPNFLYVGILKLSGNSQTTINNLLEVKETGISIERFRKLVVKNNYNMEKEELYLINPNYEAKFKLKPRKQWAILAAIPFIRNFFTTCMYAVISPKG